MAATLRTVHRRFAALLTLALLLIGRAAVAQDAAAPPASLPQAAVIPASISLDVTGSPAADPTFLDAQIRAALDREIRPTLRPGASVNYGPIVPWPLLPLAAGTRAAVNVTVSVSASDGSAPVNGITTVTLNSVAVDPEAASVLFLSDDPEYLQTDGLIFRQNVVPSRPARLYYYHSDIGLPRDLDVVLTAAVPSRVHLIQSEAGPDLDVMSVGHTVSRDFLRYEQNDEGTVVDIVPGKPFVVRHTMILQGEVAAGAVDMDVLRGAVSVSVVGSAAGGRPDAYLAGPRVPFDGHRRHGAFDLASNAAISGTYTVGGPATTLQYGSRSTAPRNIDPADDGRDYGDYGVIHRITFTLVNPTDTPHLVYLYEKPLGGPVRSSFVIDGQLKEVGCVRVPQPYWLTTYQLPAHSTGASTTLTMTDGGSFYPLEFGVTDAQPSPYTPRVGAPDGCSPVAAPFPDAGAAAGAAKAAQH